MSSKIPPRYPKRKTEMSPLNSKFQDVREKNSLCISGRNTEMQSNQKIPSKNCFGDVDLPINSLGRSKEESSEGVEKFQPLNFQKKISSEIPISRPKNVVSTSTDKYLKDNLSPPNSKLKKNEDANRMMPSVPKKSERNLKIKKKLSGSFGRKKDQNDKNQQIKYLPTLKKSGIFKRSKNQGENSRLLVENKRTPSNSNTEAILKKSTSKLVEPKKRKPSEIPLRKSRIDGIRKPKPVSMLLKKAVKEDESFFDFYSDKKTFSPIDEVSLCSELQITIDAISDSEIVDRTDSKLPERGFDQTPDAQEKVLNITLQRSSKHSNIPFDFLEEKPSSTGKKVKKLDLEKVKTSSFTLLQTDPSVLNRLESLHKQNVLNKKKVNAVSQKKSKPLSPKQIFNSVKKRSSRRSLSPRWSGIKNKSSSLIKVKRSKNEIPENSLELTENDWKILREFLLGKKLNLIPSCEKKTETNQISNTNQTLTKKEISKSLREKLARWDQKFLRKIRGPEEKEESKIPTPKKRIQLQDLKNEIPQDTGTLEKSKSRSYSEKKNSDLNSAASTKKVESFGYSKPKITTPVTPPLVSDDESTMVCDESSKNEEKTSNRLEDNSNTAEKPEGKRVVNEKEKPELIVRGTVSGFEKDESQEKINSETKVKVHLKIDLNLQEEAEESFKNTHSCDWLFKNNVSEPSKKFSKVEKVESSCSVSPDSLSPEKTKVTDKIENNEPSTNRIENESNFQENPKSGSFLRENFLNKTPTFKTKGVRKKNRSDAGDRPVPPFNPFFGSNLPLQNKIKVDHKLRNSLKKSYNKEDQREIFEEEAPVRLRRRNSEPISLSGYIWKRSNFPIFRGHKPSVSSMASSLKHLNTDDFDDFIFWEPVPQKMTSCWEMSLYQFKKPWSVLSCSVFRDNRLSNTPGLILENLRNGGNLSKRPSAGSHSERVNCAKENPFDVEPSIAQKNIDIRNWLAALNFPTASSNPSDVITEGNFTTLPSQHIVDSPNLNKSQVTPKRRKVLRNLKFPDKGSKILTKDKNQFIRIVRNSKEEVSLKDIVRGKSGGLVGRFSSRSAEEKSIFNKANDRNFSSEPKVFTKQNLVYKFDTAESGTMIDENLSQSVDEQQQLKILKKLDFYKIVEKFKLSICNSLVMFALFIILISFVLLVIHPIVSVDFIHN